ncbi:uncharacterized protein BXZ73DRAFT_39487 [Epithele typhae]|uniref:uncharacterized protein n=1 Tax=Epithele typhae TaxID=378194 RepID=UPI0020089707|nr:uncharacterized protein BXZ73DRAFT_39487 [Epithele typhae]KAH9944484.1 hypothetical protein BXZ73DRAFT_39487 [Epithele typhae]
MEVFQSSRKVCKFLLLLFRDSLASKIVECEDNPEVVKFHPSSERLVAVQCNNGSVLLLHPHDSLELAGRRPLVVAHPKHHHFTADMVWGVEASRNHLFASSASHDSGFEGFHKAFDIVTRKEVARFNAGGEACCTLALETSVSTALAQSTDASENPKAAYTLRVFEASKLISRPAQTVELEPFLAPFDRDRTYSDVNSMSVSPDGLCVALGRTDNWTDVYDTRMLTKGPLRSFGHEGEIEPESAETEGSSKRITTYGIVKTQWVNGPPYGYGLVTGGIDGDVRLWDIKRAADDPLNGRVLAHGDSDVATFCLGDVSKGEIPIILYVLSFPVDAILTASL